MSRQRSLYERLLTSARVFVDLEQSALDESIRTAAPMAHGRLLDVGCGDKPYESLFRPYVTEYVGVEFSETYDGSANAPKGKADVFYSGGRLPFEDGSFDTVLCTQVGEHVRHPEEFFADVVRVLRKEGRLIFTVPFSYRIHSEPHDFHRFTRYALGSYAEDNGMTVDLIAPRGGFWRVIGQKLTSRLAFSYSHLAGELQNLGALGYEKTLSSKTRYWVLPVTVPAIFLTAATARVLDRIDPDYSDTIGYLLVATKR